MRKDTDVFGVPTFEHDILIEKDSSGVLKRVPIIFNVSLTEFSISGIKEVDSIFSAKFSLRFAWYERRISWHNLAEDQTLNEVLPHIYDQLFVPSLLFKNTPKMERSPLDGEALVFGRREGERRKCEPRELWEVGLYRGRENPIVYTRSFHHEFTNDFDLSYFPFDTQTLIVEIGPTQAAMEVVPGMMEYTGKRSTRRFWILDWTIKQRKGERAKDHLVVVSITIQRRVPQILLSTYLPSLCILIIAQSTTYFKKEHFKTSIPMAITSMLVMYTLNQSVSAKLPPTAYVKLIDVWLLFGLLLPFVILILLILMEHLPDQEVAPISVSSAERVKMISVKKRPPGETLTLVFSKGPSMSKRAVTSFARYTLPILEITFVFLYAAVAFMVYNYVEH